MCRCPLIAKSVERERETVWGDAVLPSAVKFLFLPPKRNKILAALSCKNMKCLVKRSLEAPSFFFIPPESSPSPIDWKSKPRPFSSANKRAKSCCSSDRWGSCVEILRRRRWTFWGCRGKISQTMRKFI